MHICKEAYLVVAVITLMENEHMYRRLISLQSLDTCYCRYISNGALYGVNSKRKDCNTVKDIVENVTIPSMSTSEALSVAQ